MITAKVARRSVGGVSRSTRPASSIRATSRVAPPRERISSSASSFMRVGPFACRLASKSNQAAGSPVWRSISSDRRSVNRAFIFACAYQASQRVLQPLRRDCRAKG